MRHIFHYLIYIFFFSTGSFSTAIYNYNEIVHPVIANNGMVSSQEAVATQVGLDILKRGGNAVDAAVATAYALTVTLPRAGNITGGGFMLIYLAKENRTVFIDFREKAPSLATRDMFLDKNGNVDNNKARFSVLSMGVPGTVAGLELARKKYGTKSYRTLVKPSYLLAKNGVPVSTDLYDSLAKAAPQLLKDKDASKIFYKRNGSPKKINSILKQDKLAQTLKTLMQFGPNSFYSGKISDKLVRFMTRNNGLITLEDLKNYKAVERSPIQTDYKGYTVFTAPPPSSGGLLLSQLLYQLSNYPLSEWGHNSSETMHVMIELMKLSYSDRAKWLGDTDFVNVPISELISKNYLDKRRKLINTDTTTPSYEIQAGTESLFTHETNDTTHFSVVDKEGNAVAVTYTLNFSYGSRKMISDTGLFLNNEMDDFVAKANIPNAYGLVGSEFNQIEPEKRMLSSMSPTIITKNNQFYMVTGSPGGSRIITTTLQMILNVIEFDMTIAEATYAPRFHHQWLPDVLFIERGFSNDTLKLLESKGHTLRLSRGMGSTHSIVLKDNRLYGSSDPRKPGALTLGY